VRGTKVDSGQNPGTKEGIGKWIYGEENLTKGRNLQVRK